MRIARNILQKALRTLGYELARCQPNAAASQYPPDFDPGAVDTIRVVAPYTMTSPERVFAVCQAARYIAQNDVRGDIVECGVWRGGSMMALASVLLQHNDSERHLYLFDTFDGMAPAGENDVTVDKVPASTIGAAIERAGEKWCYASLEDVRRAMQIVGYPEDRIHYIEGLVEHTIPEHAPASIALLRLDTDWYESTKHELVHLFPRIVEGGVLIVDDYGFWEGCRKAVDEYFDQQGIRILLNRIDSTGRIAVVHRKQAA